MLLMLTECMNPLLKISLCFSFYLECPFLLPVFRVDRSEMEWMVKRAGAGVAQNQGMTDAVVKLRGLPFGCSKEEIAHFFAGNISASLCC